MPLLPFLYVCHCERSEAITPTLGLYLSPSRPPSIINCLSHRVPPAHHQLPDHKYNPFIAGGGYKEAALSYLFFILSAYLYNKAPKSRIPFVNIPPSFSKGRGLGG